MRTQKPAEKRNKNRSLIDSIIQNNGKGGGTSKRSGRRK